MNTTVNKYGEKLSRAEYIMISSRIVQSRVCEDEILADNIVATINHGLGYGYPATLARQVVKIHLDAEVARKVIAGRHERGETDCRGCNRELKSWHKTLCERLVEVMGADDFNAYIGNAF